MQIVILGLYDMIFQLDRGKTSKPRSSYADRVRRDVFHTKASFSCQIFVQKLYFGFEISGAKILYKNCERLMLMKSTKGGNPF